MTAYQRKITIALMIATFLSAIEVTIVSTAMPTIVNKLGGLELISWVYAVYLLTSAVTTPIFGKIADLFGRKKVFLFGCSLFLIGSMLCGLSQSMEQLILFRAIQGIGAGAVVPITFTIIGDIFTFEERARVQGLFASIWGVAGIFGPLVGGFFVDYVSWHWIFYINIPFGLLSIWLISKNLHEKLEKRARKIDYGGAITFTIGTTALLYALLTGGNEYDWNSPTMYLLLIVTVVFLVSFFAIQRRHPEPMIPIKLFHIREVSLPNLISFLASAILIGVTAYLPLWIQGVLKEGAIFSGMILMPMSIGWPIGATVGSRLLVRYGAKPISLLGIFLIVIGTFCLTLITMATPPWMILGMVFILGLGFGFSITIFTIVVQSAVDWSLRGVATSSNSFLRTLGQTLGVAVLGTFLNHQIGSHADSNAQVPPEILAAGIHLNFIIVAVLAVVCLAITFWLPKKRPQPEPAES
ncbi:DHA2 family efflux MFS transporter permease subunit [Brevibacillus nitrificans]|uniref:DHA2 family efflux MFS transporter permease subunit n=1 Tax=Brevibacillus nitrificans TaxID=651560 RepID=A0A3M8DIX7_9BACL|nr:MDR family MFS transporter [Brevibacillus nitrificans]RNB87978.1 DHA2 family efflux MFS transporter permease subunit [Brevibacillus nitrificans]